MRKNSFLFLKIFYPFHTDKFLFIHYFSSLFIICLYKNERKCDVMRKKYIGKKYNIKVIDSKCIIPPNFSRSLNKRSHKNGEK